MARYFCGVDAGGTRTRAVVACSETGRCGWGYAEGGNPSHQGWAEGSNQMQLAVRSAAEGAGVQIGDIVSAFCGVAGVVSLDDRERVCVSMRTWGLAEGCTVGADHDIRIALQGGLSGRPGIALIAGTGSSCYGRNEQGAWWQSGGWDQLLDDMGSGYDLARRGLAVACQSADGRMPYSRLQDVLFEALRVNNVIDFSIKIHRPRMERHVISELAPLVLGAAQAGDLAAKKIVSDAANELARMVVAVSKRLFFLGTPEIVLVGSLLEKSDAYRENVVSCILADIPLAQIRLQELRPAVGAWMLAASQVDSNYEHAFVAEISSYQNQ